MPDDAIRAVLAAELETARRAYHGLLDALGDSDWRAPSLNPGWTKGEILFHVLLGFLLIPRLLPLIRLFGRLPEGWSKVFAGLLNAVSGPFNWINMIGARGGGRLFNRQSVGRQFDRVCARILRLMERVGPGEWEMGMYYPQRWDAMFDEYMTIESVVRYVIAHFNFHVGQLG